MKIVLIQPRAHQDTPDYVNEPLGLGYLAAVLLRGGFEDVHIRTALFDDVDETVRIGSRAGLVGLTATSPMLKDALFIAERIKQASPQTVVVLGGAHATALPGESAGYAPVDLVVRGEGEETLLELVSSWQGDAPDWTTVRGVTGIKDGRVVHTPNRPLIDNCDMLPWPARSLYRAERFLDRGHMLFGDRGSWIFSSRGCPYRCTYCASNVLWTRKWRSRSAPNVMKEIEHLVDRYGVDRINFADDTFTVSARRVSEFCALLRRSGCGITWGCNVRVDTVSRELLTEMAGSGCTDIWIGAESGSDRVLKSLKKVITPEQIILTFDWAREAGMRRRGYFMIGSPEEDLATIAATEQLIDRVEPDSISISLFTPYPGCEAYQEAAASGFEVQALDWSRIDLYEKVLLPTKFLTREEIAAQHRRLLGKYHEILSTRGKKPS